MDDEFKPYLPACSATGSTAVREDRMSIDVDVKTWRGNTKPSVSSRVL
jgi:hypothetical protein